MEKYIRERDDHDIELYIDLKGKGHTLNNAKVESVSMLITLDNIWPFSDLAVNWEAQDDTILDNCIVNSQTLEMFYYQDKFTKTLQNILQNCGFSKEACNDVCTSEYGMQDIGRASYDAYKLNDEILKKLNIEYTKSPPHYMWR